MFERFTDRARKVMALANQEALRMHTEFIGTEHILVGLVGEGFGVGAHVLRNLGVNLDAVRAKVEELVAKGPTMPGVAKLPQTPRAKKVIEYAIEEARALGHGYVGTEHLLLGLLREADGVAATVLATFGLTLDRVRNEVLSVLEASEKKPDAHVVHVFDRSMRFRNKSVYVTGGARGIGREIVLAFAREGAKIAIGHTGRSPADVEPIVADVGKERAISVPGDVGNAAAARGAIESVVASFGRIDVLVNNAGICPFRGVLDVTEEEFDRVMAVNAKSVLFCSQAAARYMKDQGGGAIVNVTSISGQRFTNPDQIAYCASKAAANMLTRGLAITLAPYKIRVNAVLPGTVPTDINADVLARPGVREGIIDATPLRSLGECKDIAAATLYLASDEAKWMTGTLLVVDGGFVANG